MPFQIIRDDITRVRADAIVNSANPKPVIGGGTDSAIYHAAGERELLSARKAIGDIAPGQTAVTPAFNLPARYILHTVGPVWVDGQHGERDILRACYANALAAAADLSAESVAFPLIATGVYGFPRDEALQIALAEIGRFLLTHDMRVILVVFDRRAFELSASLMGDIEAFIDERGVQAAAAWEYAADMSWEADRPSPRGLESGSPFRRKGRKADAPLAVEDDMPLAAMSAPMMPDIHGKSLDEVLSGAGQSFQQKLFELIDERGLDDVAVYKKANIDRKVYSKMKCKADYRPKKKTAVAFAIALELDLPTMQDLLARAEIALSPSSKFDLIVMYFVTSGIYDIYEINAALFKYGQPILGE